MGALDNTRDGANRTDDNPNVILIIPAYEPNDALIELVREIRNESDRGGLQLAIVVVDDGSSAITKGRFQAVAAVTGVTVLRHAVNLGKGAALKTGFNYALVSAGDALTGVVTADADGQHTVPDILKVVSAVARHRDAIILGTRAFETEVPFRSRIGNETTRVIFRLFTGRSITDTQTGLRGMPLAVIKRALRIPAQRYEYEFELLLTEVKRRTLIVEVPIRTVYEPGNPTSHFNPLIDSLKIYYVFLRFSMLGVVAAVLDYILFVVFFAISANILASFVVGRAATGVFYFYTAKKHVFHSEGDVRGEAIKFTLLVLASMFASYGLLTVQVLLLHVATPVAKLFAEMTLGLASFAVQRVFIFRNPNTPGRRRNRQIGIRIT
jgi:glycosyltransferase involved in cell wall biosynthesis